MFEFKSLWQGTVGMKWNYENLFELFEISDDLNIPIGEYTFPQLTGLKMTPMTQPVWMMLQFEGGDYYDGKMLSVTAMPNWSISSSLILSGAYIYSNDDFTTRDQHFISHIGRVKALLMLSTKLSFSAFMQYNTESHNITSNIRFR